MSRAVLALAATCLAVTLVPLLLGWRPYVVTSGSMEPRIGAGDVVLASPNHSVRVLLGHVTVFADPAHPGTYKSHRVIRADSDGMLTTKGDANPGADPVRVPLSDVRGLGRILVRWVGQPLLWLQTGQWIPLLLLASGLLLAARLVVWDEVRRGADDALDPIDSVDLADPDDRLDPDEPAAVRPGRWSTPERGLTGRPSPWRVCRPLRPFALAGAVSAVVTAIVVPSATAAFTAKTTATASSWSVSTQKYSAAVNAVSPYLFWPLGDSTTTAADASPNGRTGTYTGGVTYHVTGPTPDDTNTFGASLTNAFSCVNTTSTTAIAAPSTFSLIVWFKAAASNTLGGKLIGFENPRTGVGIGGVTSVYDRHIYLDGNGKVWFGVDNPNLLGALGNTGIVSPASYNDGAWHMAAASLGSGGMTLYVDGKQVASGTNTFAQSTTGYWRVGCGNLAGWGANWSGPNNPDGFAINLVYNAVFTGSVADAAVVSGTVLTPTQVAQLYFAR